MRPVEEAVRAHGDRCRRRLQLPTPGVDALLFPVRLRGGQAKVRGRLAVEVRAVRPCHRLVDGGIHVELSPAFHLHGEPQPVGAPREVRRVTREHGEVRDPARPRGDAIAELAAEGRGEDVLVDAHVLRTCEQPGGAAAVGAVRVQPAAGVEQRPQDRAVGGGMALRPVLGHREDLLGTVVPDLVARD